MELTLWCLFLAILLPLVPHAAKIYGRLQAGFDNHRPRALENLPPFAWEACWQRDGGFGGGQTADFSREQGIVATRVRAAAPQTTLRSHCVDCHTGSRRSVVFGSRSAEDAGCSHHV